MTKAIFATKVDPTYDDFPEDRYHFQSGYLDRVQATRGDWIIYYEPRRSSGDLSSRGGRSSYFATAQVERIESDPSSDGYYYAYIAKQSFLPFDRPVPFREQNVTYEHALSKADGSTNKGAFGHAVRKISDQEFDHILMAGFSRTIGESQVIRNIRSPRLPAYDGFTEQQQAAYERPIVERLVARPFRDIAFVGAVKDAYENTCAMTGLKIINGGGRAEVQAAHIQPVEDDGPDSVRNGLALSGTIHWLFDRHLISIDDDFSLLVARKKIPDTIDRMLNANGRLRLPKRTEFWPRTEFLRHHRMKFKG
jgi:putative restriction endonuclease